MCAKEVVCSLNVRYTNIPSLEVPLPITFGLYYEDLELKTSDDVILRCFLLPQKKNLGAGSAQMEIARGVTEDEVCFFLHFVMTPCFTSPIYYKSLLPVDRPWLCFMGMVEILVIESL